MKKVSLLVLLFGIVSCSTFDHDRLIDDRFSVKIKISDNDTAKVSLFENEYDVKVLDHSTFRKTIIRSGERASSSLKGYALLTGSKVRVAYKSIDGKYSGYKDYTVGEGDVVLELDAGVAYDLFIYSFNSNKYLPDVLDSSGEIKISSLGGEVVNLDLIYQTFRVDADRGKVFFDLAMMNKIQRCGAYIGPGVWKDFMCQNLGATVGVDPSQSGAANHGSKYQWGYKPKDVTISDNKYYKQFDDQNNAGLINNWSNQIPSYMSWMDIFKTSNDPCPSGYRVPTSEQLNNVINYNKKTRIGNTWFTEDNYNYSTGIMFGDNLFLPASGRRNSNSNAVLVGHGNSGWYWTSSISDAVNSSVLVFDNQYTFVNNIDRRMGLSIRCIKE